MTQAPLSSNPLVERLRADCAGLKDRSQFAALHRERLMLDAADEFDRLAAENVRLHAALRDIVSTYDRRSELFTNDADLAANLRDRAARAVGGGK